MRLGCVRNKYPEPFGGPTLHPREERTRGSLGPFASLGGAPPQNQLRKGPSCPVAPIFPFVWEVLTNQDTGCPFLLPCPMGICGVAWFWVLETQNKRGIENMGQLEWWIKTLKTWAERRTRFCFSLELRFRQAMIKAGKVNDAVRWLMDMARARGSAWLWGAERGAALKPLLGPPARCPFSPFLWVGWESPAKIDYRKKGTLIRTSLLEDLVLACTGIDPCTVACFM